MRKAASEADNTLNVLRDVEGELAALGTQEPQGWPQLNYDQKVQYLDNMKNALQGTQQITTNLQHANEQKQQMLTNLNSLGVDQNQVDPMSQTAPVSAKRKMFNLKKHAQMMAQPAVEPALPATDAAMPPTAQQPAADPDAQGSTSSAQVRQLLDGFVNEAMATGVDEAQAKSQAVDQAYQKITSEFTNPNQSTSDPFASDIQGNSQQTVRDAVNSYYSTDDESEKDRAAAVLARTIFPQDSTQNDSIDDGEVPGQAQQGVKVNVAKFIKETNEIIQKLAKSHTVVATKQVFNLTKQAHVKNMTIFDPEKIVKDEFYGGPMSQNDLIERNKGYGLKLDGVYDLNWEKVWRDTVMDKYDPLYIERRFEVDKNVPATNNYQLEPGQKRRVTPPEYGILEGRLEANRDEMNKDRGYSPSEKGEPFNWKKAQQAKQAQIAQTPQDMGMTNPMKPAPMKKQEWLCHACHNALEVTDTNSPMDRCNACGALQNGKALPGEFKTGPDPAKTTTTPAGLGSGPIHASGNTEVEKLADAHGGIFFDSSDLKFVVVAGKKKKKFDTYYEAEEFKMLVKSPSAAPAAKAKQRTRLTPEQIERQRQIAHHADGLGIDG